MPDPRQLKSGQPVTKNWREINALTGKLADLWRQFSRVKDVVAQLETERTIWRTGGTLTFRGEYDAAETYQKNDVVIYGSHLAAGILSDGRKAGTYIANESIGPGDPAPGEPASLKWRTFARFATPTFAVATEVKAATETTPQEIGKILLTSSAPTATFTKTGDPGSIVIALAQAAGKQIYLREIGVCQNGVNRKMLVLGSEVYD